MIGFWKAHLCSLFILSGEWWRPWWPVGGCFTWLGWSEGNLLALLSWAWEMCCNHSTSNFFFFLSDRVNLPSSLVSQAQPKFFSPLSLLEERAVVLAISNQWNTIISRSCQLWCGFAFLAHIFLGVMLLYFYFYRSNQTGTPTFLHTVQISTHFLSRPTLLLMGINFNTMKLEFWGLWRQLLPS